MLGSTVFEEHKTSRWLATSGIAGLLGDDGMDAFGFADDALVEMIGTACCAIDVVEGNEVHIVNRINNRTSARA